MGTNNDILRPLLILIAIVLLAPVFMMLFAWPMLGMWGGGHMMHDGMWNGTGGAWLGLVIWLAVLGLLSWGGYLFYRAMSEPADETADTAIEELRLSYARGQLSDEEFEERRARLNHSEEAHRSTDDNVS